MAQDNSPLEMLRRRLRRNRLANQQFREQEHARNVESVNGLALLSDAELIAGTSDLHGTGTRRQMEMDRRLKAAIGELTAETIAARKSSDRASARIAWLNVLLVALTAALVALTVVLAVRS